MPQKECPICNKEFISTKHLRKYCSTKCSKEARKSSIKKRNDAYWADPIKREKKIKSFKNWSNKSNKKNIRDKTGRLLTNSQVRAIELKGDKKKEYNQRYSSTEKGKKTKSKYMSNYRRTNLKYRLALQMRSRINQFLDIKKITKKNKTFEYVGCTPSELKSHLEKQFYNNPETNETMTWMNWALDGWHIDHKVPLDQAKNEEDAKRLCHYTNLQPMWAKENLKKGSKIKIYHD